VAHVQAAEAVVVLVAVDTEIVVVEETEIAVLHDVIN
jgi:hypothetical protein